ncbi:MAG: hypothetical protein AABZ60_12295 [Planctomycetota bacterium]
MTFFLLYILATFDSAFCGYRAAAGQNALISKKIYYRRAMKIGSFYGQCAIAVAAVVGSLLLLFSASSTLLVKSYLQAGYCLLQIYLPYAGILCVAFLLRLIPSVDIQSLTSVFVFGPFTLLRPAVAVAGFAWALFGVPQMEVMIMACVILPMMLSMEWFLEHRFKTPNVVSYLYQTH